MMSNKTTTQTFGLFLALALIAASGPFLWSWQAGQRRGGLEVGQPMPAIAGVEWVGDVAPTSAELDGKVVFVNAWFLACRYCHEGMPKLVELHDKYRDRGDVVFIGLADEPPTETSRKNVELFLKSKGVEWPNAFNAGGFVTEQFKTQYYPGYWIIGRDGKVVWNKDSTEDMAAALERAVQS